MVAALAALRFGRAAELAAPEDQRRIEQAAPLQILEQRGDRLVGLRGHAEVVLLDVVVRVPLHVARAAAGDQADEAHALLDQPPRQQAAPAVVVGRLLADAVQVERLLRLAGEVEDLGRLGLHLERQIVGVDARGEFVVVRRHVGLVQVADQVERLAALRPGRRPAAGRG